MLRPSIVLIGSLAVCALALTIAPRKSEAHSGDLGFVWFSNDYNSENVNDLTNDATWDATGNAWVWYSGTDLHLNTSNGTYQEITLEDAAYGTSYPRGWAQVYSNNYTCASLYVQAPGGCNKTTEKATTAVISLNTSTNGDQTSRNLTLRHEYGHVFGLSHPGTCQNVLMDDGSCNPHVIFITQDEVNHVASLY